MNLSSLVRHVQQALIFLSLVLSEQAVAFSQGAGHCDSGTAISGGHGSAGNAGSLLAGDYRLFIGGAPLDPGTSVVLTPGNEHTITLQSTANGTFKGFFFRLSGKAGENVKSSIKLSPDYASIGHDNFRCASLPVGGITHNTGIEKEAVAVVVNSNDPIDMLLEVTVVKSRSNPNAWHFDSYNIRFEAEVTAAPTANPTSQPTSQSAPPSHFASLKPSATVSDLPTAAPSSSPSVSPSTKPTLVASNSPSKVASESPSTSPSVTDASANPSTQKSSSPSVTDSNRPSLIPSSKPSIALSGAPSSPPSMSPSILDSEHPSVIPSWKPSILLSGFPSAPPSISPSVTDSDRPSVLPSPESPGNLTLENGDATNGSLSVRFHWNYALVCAAMFAFMI